MTWCLYRNVWYEIDPDYVPSVKGLVADMLEQGELVEALVSVAEARFSTVGDIFLAMHDDGADRVYDEVLEAFYEMCSDDFEAIVLPHVEATQEVEPE